MGSPQWEHDWLATKAVIYNPLHPLLRLAEGQMGAEELTY